MNEEFSTNLLKSVFIRVYPWFIFLFGISYYYGRQNSMAQTAALMDALLAVVEIPTTGQAEALGWRTHGISDFEDALQVASAIAGFADFIITRNEEDFIGSSIPARTPEVFLGQHPT